MFGWATVASMAVSAVAAGKALQDEDRRRAEKGLPPLPRSPMPDLPPIPRSTFDTQPPFSGASFVMGLALGSASHHDSTLDPCAAPAGWTGDGGASGGAGATGEW